MELDNRDIYDISWDINQLSEDELGAIEFFNLISQDEAKRQTYINGFLSNPQEYLAQLESEPDEVYNGPVIGLVAAFAFNWVTGGLMIALITLGAGLIQWALSDKATTAERKADPRFSETYSGSAGAGIVKLGEPIPVIFCNRDIDSTGGVQTPGQLIFSRVFTSKGVQTLYARYIISHGNIGEIDISKTLVNDQPLMTFVQTPNISWLNGDANQVIDSRFAYYSQNFPLSTNNKANIRMLDENAGIVNGNQIEVTSVEYDEKFNSFSVGGLYWYNAGGNKQGFFKINQKIRNENSNSYLVADRNIQAANGGAIFAYEEARYQTTKPVNQIELNFSCNIWKRDSSNNLQFFAQLFKVYFAPIGQAQVDNFTEICHLYVLSKNPQKILRGFTIFGLDLNTYVVKICPTDYVGASPVYELWDYGSFTEKVINIGQGNKTKVRFDGYETPLNTTSINNNVNQRKSFASVNSTQQAIALEIISVNELEFPSTGKNTNMAGFATVQFETELNAAINGSLNLTFFVAKGIIGRKLLAAGIAEDGSSGATLSYAPGHGQGVGAGTDSLTLANHTKRTLALVTNMPNSATVVASSNINLEPGDTWSLFKLHSSCWWPEIYMELCLVPKFGVASKVIADYYLDWVNLVETCKWLAGDNEFNQKFAWHGVINETQNLAQLNEEQARKVLLQPWRGQGLSGFWPYKTPTGAVPIFNSSNATDFKIEYLTNQPPNQIIVVYQEREQLYIPGSAFGTTTITQTVTAITQAAYRGLQPARSQTLKIPECTSREQAVKIAQVYLNQARYGSRLVASHKAKTIESMHYYPGSLYRIMTATTSYSDEQSGIVIAKSEETKEFRLDREFTLVKSTTSYADSNPLGLRDDRIDFVQAGVSAGDVVRNLESNAISIVTSVAADRLSCTPSVPKDTHYEIGDLTTGGLVAACSGGNSDIKLPQVFSARCAKDGHIWLKLSDNYLPNIGDIIGIGKNGLNDRLFQALSLTVQLEEVDDSKVGQLSVNLSGVNWDIRFFDFSDITIQTRNGTFNG